jgi:hypothetical protein
MKLLYTTYVWHCRGCGFRAWEAKVPPTTDVTKYAPCGECGKCGSVAGFERRAAA